MAEFGVSVGELRRVSSDLHEVSSAMKGVMSALGAQLAAAGPAWGGGEMGDQFADGPNGYLAQLAWVEGSVQAKTGLLDYYSDLLKQAADSFEQADNNGVSSPAAAGTIPGIGSGNVPAGGVGATNGVPPPVNATASPTTPTEPSAGAGGRGSRGASRGSEPETPSSPGRTPRKSGAAGEGAGSTDATPGSPVNGDLPGDRVTAGVDAEDGASARLAASTPEGMLDSSTTSPDAGPFTNAAGSAPPNLPALPRPPAPPNRPNQRRAGAPDEPVPPSPAKDAGSGPPSRGAQAEPGKQHTGAGRVAGGRAGSTGVDRPAQDAAGPPARSRSAAGRASVADRNTIRGDAVARARRGRPDPAERSDIAGDPLADADAVGLVAGHFDEDSDDDAGSHPRDERGLGEDSRRRDGPHRDR